MKMLLDEKQHDNYRYNLTLTNKKDQTLVLVGELTADSKAKLLELLNIHPQQVA